MGDVLQIQRAHDYDEVVCGECGIMFLIESWLKARWVNERHVFHCPNGHQRQFSGETEAERVRRELTAQLTEAQRTAEWAKVRATNAEKRARAAKGQITKLQKRVGNGVCPCCHRTFSQLAAHMARKHPAFSESAESTGGEESGLGVG